MSLYLRPTLDPAQYPLLTVAAGVAIADAIEGVVGVVAGIKWPNDILVAGKKCAGILAESDATTGWAIVGIGVDVSVRFPLELADQAISLTEAAGKPVDRVELLVAELASLAQWLPRVAEAPDDIIQAVCARDVLRDQWVTVETVAGTTTGIARGVDARGALLVEVDGDLRPMVAGIVRLKADDG